MTVLRTCGALSLAMLATLVAGRSVAHAGSQVWTTHGPGGAGTDVLSLEVLPSAGAASRIFAGTFAYPDGSIGIFTSTDSGETWASLGIGLTGYIWSIAIDPHELSTMYAGTFGILTTPVYKSIDGGATWQPSSVGISERSVQSLAIDPLDPSTIYACGPNAGVFRTTDAGLTWVQKNVGRTSTWAEKVILDSSNPSTLYVAGFGLARSDDGAESWRMLSGDEVFWDDIVRAIAMDPSNPSTLYIGTDSYGILKTGDGGETWNQIFPDMPNSLISEIVVDPVRTTTVYAAIVGQGVFKIVDAGATWAPLNAGLTDPDVWSLALDPAHPATLYAGTRHSTVFQLDQGPVCGNAVIEEGEECDTGPTVGSPGSCCTVACKYASARTACASDDDLCTNDLCDGAGECVHRAEPAPDCRGPISRGAATLGLRTAGARAPAVTMRWAGAANDGDFGNPFSPTEYALCVYDGVPATLNLKSSISPDRGCNNRLCWQRTPSGFLYRAPSAISEGIRRLSLRRTLRHSHVDAAGRGSKVSRDVLPARSPVVAQIRSSDGECRGATFTAPSRNTSTAFRAGSD